METFGMIFLTPNDSFTRFKQDFFFLKKKANSTDLKDPKND